MPTPFKKIYSKFLNSIDDLGLASLDDSTLKELLKEYLENSVAVEFKKCRKDLSDIIEPKSYSNEFAYDGTNNIFAIDIPPSSEFDITVKLNDTELNDSDYIFNLTNGNLTVSSAMILGDKIKVNWEFEGQFNEDLSIEECFIIALGMVLNYLQPKINKEQLIRQGIGDRDYKLTSSANHLDKLLQLEERTIKKLRKYILSYSYDGIGL